MQIEFNDGRIQALTSEGIEAASCSAAMKDGLLYLQDLAGNDVSGVMAIFRFAKELSDLTPVLFPLREGGVYEGLRSIAQRMGAQPYVQVWCLGDIEKVFKNGK